MVARRAALRTARILDFGEPRDDPSGFLENNAFVKPGGERGGGRGQERGERAEEEETRELVQVA